MNKVMLIGWDAADWRVINPLMDAGRMPNLKALIERGSMGNLATLSPVLSPMLWTSIATGKRPFRHGILGFTEPTADRTSVQPITNLSRRCKAVWNILNQSDKRSVVVGWWPSHPAEPINGAMVSNQYQRAPDGPPEAWKMPKNAVFPDTLADELKELRFHPTELTGEDLLAFIPNGAEIDQSKDKRIFSCARILADAVTIQSAATHLLETQDWDFAAVYFDAIDHFCHSFMRFHPPKREDVSQEEFDLYKNVVSAGYIFHDAMLGTLLEYADDDTTVMLISDHGFHPDDLRPKMLPSEPAGPAAEHRDFGIFVMAGPGVKQDNIVFGASLLDITPTILTAFGLPVGEDMDGRALLDAFENASPPDPIKSWEDVAGDDGRHPTNQKLDSETSQEMLKQLADLGYIDADNSQPIENTERELSYNLALSYMDANLHGNAAEILAKLYADAPLEFRFGIRLALCYQSFGQIDAMEAVVVRLNETWRIAAETARERLQEFRKTISERKQASGDEETDSDPVQDKLISDAERSVVRQLRGIARGNKETLEYLFAGIATARGDHAAALEHLEVISQSSAKRPGLFIQTGNAYVELKRFAEAKQAFLKALALDSDHPAARLGLARVALGQDDPDEALKQVNTSLGLKFQNAAGHYYKAVALHRGGRPAEAAEALQTALSFNPNFAEAHDRLSQIYTDALEDKALAVTHRTLAQTLRRIAAESTEKPAIEAPSFAEVDIDAHLPAIPKPVNLLPPLAAARSQVEAAKATGKEPAIIVAGLPRSGTSLAMQMLRAGGIPVLDDNQRDADDNNPKGYLEYDPVRSLPKSNDWVDNAQGKALKVVTPLVPYLPQSCSYKVVMMERPINEVVASQTSMLDRLERDGAALEAAKVGEVLAQQRSVVLEMLGAHEIPVLALAYHDVLADPKGAASRMAAFLGQDLDLDAMAAQVDPSLHRERQP